MDNDPHLPNNRALALAAIQKNPENFYATRKMYPLPVGLILRLIPPSVADKCEQGGSEIDKSFQSIRLIKRWE